MVIEVAAHQFAIDVFKVTSYILRERKIRVPVTRVVPVIEDAACATRFVAVWQIEIVIAPFLVFWIVCAFVFVTSRLHCRVKINGVLIFLGAASVQDRGKVAAAAKLIGGLDFNYSIKGDGLAAPAPVADADQRRALDALIATLDPAALDLPEALLNRLSPAASGETFDGDTGPMFDLIAAADTSAGITMDALLNPARAARLVEMKRRDAGNLGLVDVMQAIEQAVFANVSSPRMRAIARQEQTRFVSSLIALSTNDHAAPGVRAIADARLRSVANRLSPSFFGGDAGARDHNAWLMRRIEAHLTRPAEAAAQQVSEPETPPGSPIGSGMMEECWHCDTAVR